MVRKIKIILWVIVNLFCLLGIFICIFLYRMDRKVLLKDNGYIYFALQHESNPFEADVQQIVDFKDKLENTNLFQYYEIYGQPLYSSDICLPKYESEQKTEDGIYELETIQIGYNVLKDFGVALQEGCAFQIKDYKMGKDKNIPVVIGADWSGTLKIGDSFIAEYLYDTYQFHVIGILQPQAMIYMTNRIYLLDKDIIMPSFEVTDYNILTNGLKIHYANKVSGIMKVKKENQECAQRYLLSCLENTSSGVYTWYATTYDCNLRRIFHLGIKEILFLYIVIIAVGNYFIIVKKYRH